jgi:hypothetical protein
LQAVLRLREIRVNTLEYIGRALPDGRARIMARKFRRVGEIRASSPVPLRAFLRGLPVKNFYFYWEDGKKK